MTDPSTLWNSHLIVTDDNSQFVDSHLLDAVSGIKINNRQRDIRNAVENVIKGSGLDPNHLIHTIQTYRHSKPSIFIAVSFKYLLFKELIICT